MKLTEWHKSESDHYPELVDRETSIKYVIVRRNITEIANEGKTFYEYDEKMIPRADWNVYEDVLTATPYTDTKTAYIDDTEVTFENVPNGSLSVSMQDSDGNYPNYNVERNGDRITVSFEPLEYVATVTISIM